MNLFFVCLKKTFCTFIVFTLYLIFNQKRAHGYTLDKVEFGHLKGLAAQNC